MRSCQIFITGDFDGGNPKDKNSIKQIENDVFEIVPYSEDNDPNYKFRLDIKAINRSNSRQNIHLIIIWNEPIYSYLRDYLYIKNSKSKDWVYISGFANESETRFKINLEQGENYICLHPKYNYEDYINYLDNILITDNIKKEIIGYTTEGRELWLIKIAHKNIVPKKKILILSRIHPYETAGSYNVEGIINYFVDPNVRESVNNNTFQTFPFDNYEINIIPMANPDGVFNGLTKRTSPNGIDLSKQTAKSDRICHILMETIDIIKPHIYVEFHNWMFKERDGIYFLNWFQARRFIKQMPSQISYNKQWISMLKHKIFSIKHIGLKKYAKEKYNSKCACFEFPWFKRTTSDMEQVGLDTLKAISIL